MGTGRLALSLALGVVLLAGCEEPTCDREPPVTWENWGEAYIATFCVGCHSALLEGDERRGATPGVDLNNYGDVMRHVDRIEARATGPEPTMPPSGGPSAEQVALLEEWLHCTVRPDAEELGL